MRPADREEVWAAGRKTPAGALVYSMRKSSHAWTALIDGRPEVMFGVGDVNVLAGIGAPWLLGTDAIETHAVAFIRYSVEFRGQLLSRYQILRNYVDERNTVAVRWLQWVGFTLLDRVEFNGVSFRLFEMRADNV